MNNKFMTLGLDKWVLQQCATLGYNEPTKIQQMAIPSILKNKNTIINSETGSGKTATFAMPMLQKLAKDTFGIFGLILTPNRELAVQIYQQLMAFGSKINLKCCVLIGGVDMTKQMIELDVIPHIIVATPGRLVHLFDHSEILQQYIENLQVLVIDECDRIFNQTILPDLQFILKKLPKEKQIILASATLDDDLDDKKINEILQMNIAFEKFSANLQIKIVESLNQKYIFVPNLVKDQYLLFLLKKFQGVKTIIFVNRCKKCHVLGLILKELGISNSSLHSYLKQGKRIANLKRFRNSQEQILVATDVASRGLDIPTVDLVINYDIPRGADDYIHRVGRTARKGKRGLSISIITQTDVSLIQNIEEHIKQKMTLYEINEEEVLQDQNTIAKAKRKVKLDMLDNGMSEFLDEQEQARRDYHQQLKENKKDQL